MALVTTKIVRTARASWESVSSQQGKGWSGGGTREVWLSTPAVPGESTRLCLSIRKQLQHQLRAVTFITFPPPLRLGERISKSTWRGGLVSAAASGNLPFQAIPTAPHLGLGPTPWWTQTSVELPKAKEKKKITFKHLKNMWEAVVVEAIFGHLFCPYFHCC